MFINKKNIVAVMAGYFLLTGTIFAKGNIDVAKDISQIIKMVEDNYYGDNEIDEEKMREAVLKAMMQSLGDKHSGYFTDMDMKSFQANLDGKYPGLGLTIQKKDNESPTVGSIIDGGPAQKAGIKVGDSIETLDGVPTKDKTVKDLLQKVRGEANTTINLGILSQNSPEIKSVSLTREIINKKYVSYSMLEENIGYLKITQFGNNIYTDVENKIKEMQAKGMTSLILDLRDNPGGSLMEAVKVSSLFIGDGRIVSTKGRNGKEYVYNRQGDYLGNFPLVVLINEKSASASEICAGAIRDYKRGVLIGEKSFGKGSVQQTVPLKNGGGIKLTVAKYFTPTGDMINGKGLTPHIVVDGLDNQMEKAKSILKNHPLNPNEKILVEKV